MSTEFTISFFLQKVIFKIVFAHYLILGCRSFNFLVISQF